ncbi:MAG TPA: AsmA-like C-terminal region-containing protein [Candidatus Sulfotelmatobacter sp.]
MASAPTSTQPSARPIPVNPAPRQRRSRRWVWILSILLLLAVAGVICIRLVIARAEPILRTRVIETLAARFKSRVELAELHVWVANGLHVSGKGLQIYGLTDPNPYLPGVQPLLEIGEFQFQTSIRNLFVDRMHVDTVQVTGMIINIPPKQQRAQMTSIGKHAKIKIVVDKFVCRDTKLVINTLKPGKAPLIFDIGDLRMKDIGPGQPLRFDATLVNPKPVGDIKSIGFFGPLNEDSPRDSAVKGDYSFTNADLGTLKGIGGILSSTGQYGGTLGRIEVQGKTETPDFRLDITGHPVPLRTDFHAIVDGTDGDTYLDPVQAQLLHSTFTATGKIVRTDNPRGHDIELDVVLNRAHIEDLLQLGVKTNPPIMNGPVEMKTKLSLPPGPKDVPDRLKLVGNFHIPTAHFSSDKIQGRIDSLSLRSQGKPKEAQQHFAQNVPSDLQGTFRLNNGVLSFYLLHFLIPGTHADMAGQYSLDGNTFDFHGKLKLDAKLSQMMTGWKSILLKPVDPFFHKNGAGTEVPFKISGTKSEPHFGLDFGDKRELPNDKDQKPSR